MSIVNTHMPREHVHPMEICYKLYKPFVNIPCSFLRYLILFISRLNQYKGLRLIGATLGKRVIYTMGYIQWHTIRSNLIVKPTLALFFVVGPHGPSHGYFITNAFRNDDLMVAS